MSATVSQSLRLDRHADAVVGSDVRRGVCLRQIRQREAVDDDAGHRNVATRDQVDRHLEQRPAARAGEARLRCPPSAQILIDPRIVFPARVTLA